VQFVTLTHESHATKMLEIFNDAIANSTALFDYKPRASESMVGWFQAKEVGRFPVIGAIAHDQLLGFATYGPFRAWPAYKYSVEHSVYVHKDHRGKGIGLALMRILIERAKEQQYHVMVGGIDVTNTGSIALHARLGFVHAGTVKHAGFKFGKWLDLGLYQLLLETPDHPVDG
jgi:L-amino acid N-acyltransferase YncA